MQTEEAEEMTYLVCFLLSIVAACITHEAGHYLAALMLKRGPKLILKFPPVVTWETSEAHGERVIAVAGFTSEIIPAFPLVYLGMRAATMIYLAVYAVHLFTYPFRMTGREENDFRYLS